LVTLGPSSDVPWNERPRTDERLDDVVARLDTSISLLREELREFRAETRQEFRAMRGEFSSMQRQIIQIGWALATALIVTLVAGFTSLIIALA
jgi:hypothetical protein